jgi:catechol 2,3-dioxygenase-like lactoylglutathione lyase family enzyme
MKPVAIRYVRDVDEARKFYQALGLAYEYGQRPSRRGTIVWTELTGAGGLVALHHVPDDEPHVPVELSFESGEPLEDVVERLRAAGYEPEAEIVDETFGRMLAVRDPEGLMIHVIEHDRTI